MIEAKGIVRYLGGREVLHAVDLGIGRGEIFCIVGPNGAGKTTLLRVLDLLDPLQGGQLCILGEDVTRSEEARFRVRRRISMLFQRPVFFSISVLGNVALGLRYRGLGEIEARERARAALRCVGLEGCEERAARELSGGELQRVALARAIATEPEILLLDEPMANLDPASSAAIEETIQELSRRKGVTIVFTTHDLHQGERLADRIGVLMDGRFSQIASAIEVFHHPADLRIARFVGFENILPGRVLSWENGEALVEVGGTRIYAMSPEKCEGEVSICFRAESVAIGVGAEPLASPRNRFRGRISRMSSFGPFVYLTIDCGVDLVALLTRRAVEDLHLASGSEVWASVKATSTRIFAEAACNPRGRETEKH